MAATLILRRVKGTPLTNDELDDNLENLNDAIQAIEDNPPVAPSMTPSQILAGIVQVDGTGSGLDADLLDGLNSTAFAVVGHDHAGVYATAAHTHAGVYADAAHTHTGVYEPADNTILKDADIGVTVAAQNHTHAASSTLSSLLTVDGAGSGLDADLLDGQNGAYYATAASVTGKLAADLGAGNFPIGTMICGSSFADNDGIAVAPGGTSSTLFYADAFAGNTFLPGTWRNVGGFSVPNFFNGVFNVIQRIA
jgi:hypothetical protein